jgi:PIN domain nuclease of toxin-antitoxin system
VGGDGGGLLILLDTHALLDLGLPEIGLAARTACNEALHEGRLAVSAISFCEAAALIDRQRFQLDRDVRHWRDDLLIGGLVELPVDGEIEISAVALSDLHRDPADRLIVATALRHGARLVTADQRILAWPGPLDRQDARS